MAGVRQKDLENMNQIGTGAGLVALSVGMVATAIIATHPVGTGAFAEEQASIAPQSSRVAGFVTANSTASSLVSGCDPQAWFDPIPHEFIAGCAALACLPLSPSDVNRDGTAELFSAPASVPIAGGNPIVPYPISGFLQWSYLFRSSLGAASGAASVFDFGAELGAEFIARLPDRGGDGSCAHSWDIQLVAKGWLDCDDDGDLDLVVTVQTFRTDCSWSGQPWACRCWRGLYSSTDLWFENTGYQAGGSPYDLDRDGLVNNADLSLLLMEFTD
jgi:hypothetical protein